jgi:hypothetical protein
MSDLNPDQVVETFSAASDENKLTSMRHGQVVHLPAEGEVWMTGDIHDHRNNFKKLIAAADLGNNPQRHLILHELIHGDHFDQNGAEDSWRMLYQAAELKVDFPAQVHFLLANHDLAQIHGEGIMKAGLSVCEAFYKGLKRDIPNNYHMVNVSITDFLLSLPLAIRTHSGMFFCHSVPTDDNLQNFDFTVFDRDLAAADYKRRTGPVYQLIWGRNTSPAGATAFMQKVQAKMLITGHQPQEMGYAINGQHHLIIASDHNQGVFLPMDLSETYDVEQLVGRLQKFVALTLDQNDV